MNNNNIKLNDIWDFSFNDGPQTSVTVPNCFDTLKEYQFKRGIGTYSQTVEASGQVELFYEALGLRAKIYWDENLIWEEKTPYTPNKIKFDAGSLQLHTLKIVCDNTIDDSCESEFRSFYDFYGFGGIFHNITLRKLPTTAFDYVKVIPNIENKSIDLQVKLFGPYEEIKVYIDDVFVGLLPETLTANIKVPNGKLWSPETPNLHKLTLISNLDTYTCNFGLRKIEAKDGKIYLNNQEIKLVGVNRHEVHPSCGAATSKEIILQDLKMIKAAGFNMIRGAHYPQCEDLLNAADSLGILIWNEIIGWGPTIESLINQEFQSRQCDSLTRMITTSINHPSIIMWGFLNEGATDKIEARPCVSLLYNTAKALDDSRLITYASMYGEKDLCLDLVDVVNFNTYPGWYGGTHTFFEQNLVIPKLNELLNFVKSNPSIANKPVIISEIGAAAFIGDHSKRRWSEEYQASLIECAVNYTLNNPDYSGILLWQFCNSPVDDNIRIMMRPRGYNNKGLVDEYRREKLAWKLFPKILAK